MTTKIAICSYVVNIVLTARMVECKLEIAHNIPGIITVTRVIELAVEPSQIRAAT